MKNGFTNPTEQGFKTVFAIVILLMSIATCMTAQREFKEAFKVHLVAGLSATPGYVQSFSLVQSVKKISTQRLTDAIRTGDATELFIYEEHKVGTTGGFLGVETGFYNHYGFVSVRLGTGRYDGLLPMTINANTQIGVTAAPFTKNEWARLPVLTVGIDVDPGRNPAFSRGGTTSVLTAGLRIDTRLVEDYDKKFGFFTEFDVCVSDGSMSLLAGILYAFE